MVARTVGGRFERQIPDAVDAQHTHPHVLRFHDVAALTDGRYRLRWFVAYQCKRCRGYGERFTEPAARIGRDGKLDTIRDAYLSRVSCKWRSVRVH